MKRTLLFAAAAAFTFQSNAQLTPDGAYLIGDFVEIGIHNNGHEGTVDLAGSHSRGGSSTLIYFGFVADPEETGWVDYNGDFYTPGSPENGFGVYVNDTLYHSNGMLSGTISPWTDTLVGAITDYTETTDSIWVNWVGTAGDLELSIDYILRKDEHFYTTELSFTNIGTAALSDIYYYRNLDPDNNQTVGAGYTTSNVIVSQGSISSTEISEVTAFQTTPWYSEFTFVATGDMWKAYSGGFSNRNAAGLWNDTLTGVNQIVGDTVVADQAIGIAYKIETLPTGKASAHTSSFITRFKPGAVSTLGMEKSENPLSISPSVTSDQFQINLEGNFEYFVIDMNGRIIAEGRANNTEIVDVTDFPNGIYFVKARTNKAFYNAKVVKQ